MKAASNACCLSMHEVHFGSAAPGPINGGCVCGKSNEAE